jgi:hypothetical protein
LDDDVIEPTIQESGLKPEEPSTMIASPFEGDIARRVASGIASGWDAYWRRTAKPEDERSASLAHARGLFDLVGEVEFGEPVDGWEDPEVLPAAMVLSILGDGYALASVEWPEGLPYGSAPDFESASNALVASGINEWCARQGYPVDRKQQTMRSSPQDRPEVTLQHQADSSDEIVMDFVELRSREDPDWDDYESATQTVAERLNEWLFQYRALLSRMQDGQAYESLQALRRGRASIVAELAWVRRALPLYQHRGAQAEAITGIALIAALMRTIYLAGTASDPEDFQALHTMPLDFLESFVAKFELEEWIDRILGPLA